ncbi:hypothetical protein HDU89_001858 [Geranomyces variabilis]|nr:hypothetical protein HDU89_001858 [Geranomyces variabilis]
MDFAGLVDSCREHLQNRARRGKRQSVASGADDQESTPKWNWTARKLATLLIEYPSGLTKAVVHCELEIAWDEYLGRIRRGMLKSMDAVLDGKPISSASLFEAPVEEVKLLPGTTRTYILSLATSTRHVDMYLHQKFSFLAEEYSYLLRQMRLIRIAALRSATTPEGRTRLLPTEHMLILLDAVEDSGFLELFGNNALSDAQALRSDDVKVHVEVIAIDAAKPGHLDSRIKRVDVHVCDSNGVEACLVLWEDQIALASLFGKGDYLAIWRPFVTVHDAVNNGDVSSIQLECGSLTVLFCVPGASSHLTQGEWALGPTQDPSLSQAVNDVEHYSDRILIGELGENMINVSLLGRITEVMDNAPIQVNGKKADRYRIRLADHSGSCNFTLWGAFGRSCIGSLSCGDWLFISNVNIEAPGSANGGSQLNVAARNELGSTICNVSCIVGLVASLSLRTTVKLENRYASDCVFFNGTVIGWEPQDDLLDFPIAQTHSTCGRIVEPIGLGLGNDDDESPPVMWCNFCKQTTTEKVPAYRVRIAIKDESGTCVVDVTPSITADFLGRSAAAFAKASRAEKASTLEALRGRLIQGCLVTGDPSQADSFRLAAVAETSIGSGDV